MDWRCDTIIQSLQSFCWSSVRLHWKQGIQQWVLEAGYHLGLRRQNEKWGIENSFHTTPVSYTCWRRSRMSWTVDRSDEEVGLGRSCGGVCDTPVPPSEVAIEQEEEQGMAKTKTKSQKNKRGEDQGRCNNYTSLQYPYHNFQKKDDAKIWNWISLSYYYAICSAALSIPHFANPLYADTTVVVTSTQLVLFSTIHWC